MATKNKLINVNYEYYFLKETTEHAILTVIIRIEVKRLHCHRQVAISEITAKEWAAICHQITDTAVATTI